MSVFVFVVEVVSFNKEAATAHAVMSVQSAPTFDQKVSEIKCKSRAVPLCLSVGLVRCLVGWLSFGASFVMAVVTPLCHEGNAIVY